MEEKMDWFFDDDDWLENDDLDDESLPEISSNTKKPLSAISLRVPKALPPQIDATRNNSDELDAWPDDQSFKLNKWQRKGNTNNQYPPDFHDSFDKKPLQRRKNIPRSNRRKY